MNVSQKFQTSAVIRKYRSGQADSLWFWYLKNHLFRMFFVVFSGTAHELMVPAKPSNTQPTLNLMPKEPTDFLILFRR